MSMNHELSTMIGKTLTHVSPAQKGDDELVMTASDGTRYRFYHRQDCCEKVEIEDVCGDLQDLIGSPILQAEEVNSDDWQEPEYAHSYTWTFYKFGTAKGFVTVRWLGESNGYYSESVDIEVTKL